MAPWQELVQRIKRPDDELTIHVVGKYTGYEDSYKSLNEALYHGGFAHRLRINIQWVEAEALEQDGGDAAARRLARHPGAGRLRVAWHARDDEGGRVRSPPQGALFRHLLRVPVGDRGVRKERACSRGPTRPKWTKRRPIA